MISAKPPIEPVASISKQKGETWQAMSADQSAATLQTNLSSGLTSNEACQRLEKSGPNRLQEEEREPFWKEFIEELREPLILLLIFTGVLYAILGELSEAITS